MRLSSRPLALATAIALVAAGVSIAAPGNIALAAPTLDQQQPTIDSLDRGATVGSSIDAKVAQVVQVGIAGSLAQVDLPVICMGSSTLTVEIRDVITSSGQRSPGATVLASSTVANGSLPPADATGFRSFTFGSGLTFAAGAGFAVVLSATGPGALDSCYLPTGPAGDSYSPADGWFLNTQQVHPFNPGGWNCMCGATAASAFDLPFRTYMNVPTPTGADLSITKTLVNPSNLNVFAATEQIYQLTVTNAGPATATGVTIVDTLPANVTVVQAHPACANNAGILTCTLGPTLSNLAAGGSFSISIKVEFNNAGSYTNTATVSANEADPNTANNTSSHTQQVLPTADLLLESMNADAMADPGTTITYEAIVRNLGPDPASDVTLIHAIPAATTFVSVSSPQSTICGPGSNANEYGCRFSAGIPVGDTRSVTVTVTAPTTPQMMVSSATATHNLAPLVFDPDPPDGAPSSFTDFRSWVIQESVTQSVAGGGTVTTDTEADGATPNDPVEVSVTSPTGGSVTITESENTQPSGATTNWTFLGAEIVITAAAGTKTDPLILTFRLDKALVEKLKPLPPATSAGPLGAPVQVFRNNTSTTPVPPVPDCPMTTTDPPQPVLPLTSDPCVASRTTLTDGDLEIVVYTSQASVWTFATRRPFGSIRFEAPLGAVRSAGSTLPVKFTLFDAAGGIVSEPGLNVLASGSPSSRRVACDTAAPLDGYTAASIIGRGLHFDPETDVYSINWKTDKAWTRTCRQLLLRLIDGSEHTVLIEFK